MTFSINEFYEKIKDFPWIDIEYPTHKYAIEVVTGKRLACKWEKLSCERHLRDLLRQNTDEFPYVFDFTRSNLIFNWFSKRCTHVRGIYSGQPIELVALQKYDLGSVYGWVHRETGYRRFKYSYNKVGRGHAKSTVQSGIATFAMVGDCYYPPFQPDLRQFDMSPTVYCAATDRKQAKLVWEDAQMMAKNSPKILKDLEVKRTFIRNKVRGGSLEALSKETQNKNGLSICTAIVDEYHEWKTSIIFDAIRSAFGKRPQELLNTITTAGINAENSPCKKEEDICKKILEGTIIDERYFVNIRELDKDDNPHDMSVLPKANPMLHEIENGNEYAKNLFEIIQSEHNLAYGSNDYGKIREYLTKRCNLWQNESENMFLDGLMEKLKSLAVSREEFLKLTKGRECIAGIDLSKATDLTATAYLFRLEDGRYAITAHGYIAEDKATKHEKTDRVPYIYWADEGWCTLTPGGVVDYTYLINDILDVNKKYEWKVREVAYDPYSAEYCTQDLYKKGITRVEVPQRVSYLSEATKLFKHLIIEGNLVHDGSPLFIWCASNAVITTDHQENIMLSKKDRNDTQRIDLLAASINALSRGMSVLKPKRSIIYVPSRRKKGVSN